MTLSVAVPVPKVALCAPAATPTLNSISWPVLLKKLPDPALVFEDAHWCHRVP